MPTRLATGALLLLLVAAAGGAAAADVPDVGTIVSRMRTALEPAKSSTRRLTLTVTGMGSKARFTLVQARKVVGGQPRMLTVVLAPQDERGVASLIMKGTGGQADVRALWVPAVRRTRLLTPVGGYEAYLNSDFAYADLGFVDTSATYALRGTTTRAGKAVYQVEAVPQAEWYYSKIVAFVDEATLLPLERHYYDPGGTLWKVETFEDVTVIDGQPVATHITMADQQTKESSTLLVESLRFDVDLPDALFDPASLRSAIDSPAWPDAR